MITSDVNPKETFQIGKQLQHIKFILTICLLLLQIRFSFQPSNRNTMCLMVLKSLSLLGFADSINLRKC